MRTVDVYKADLPLREGESINMFLDNLRGAIQAKFGKPRVGNKPGTYAFLRAAFAKRLVMEQDAEGPDARKRTLLAVEYSRKDNGDFEFGTPSEVREQVEFVSVSKANDSGPEKFEIGDDFWKGLLC